MVKYLSNKAITDKKLTQKEVILLHLLDNGYITNKQASDNYGYHHLPSIIRDLKKEYNCEFENIRQKSLNRFKQGTEYDEYHLKNKEEIKRLLQ